GPVKLLDTATGQELRTLPAGWNTALFTPDGHRIAVLEPWRLKVFDGAPLTPESRDEREALHLVEFLFARPLPRDPGLAYLRDCRTISEPVRQQALTFAERFKEAKDPKRYHEAAWAVARQPAPNPFQVRFALGQAEAACRLADADGFHHTARGILLYRQGKVWVASGRLATASRPKKETAPAPRWNAFLS